MVMYMLSCNNRRLLLNYLLLSLHTLVTRLSSLLLEAIPNHTLVSVVDSALLNTSHTM